jgi:L-seryl-tRNA(Ser) seleniumtransferase
MNDLLRKIPKVDEVLRHKAWEVMSAYPETIAKDCLREVFDTIRAGIKDGSVTALPSIDEVVAWAARLARNEMTPHLRRVINGTGVVIHTNLGRSLLAKVAIERMLQVASGYSNVEFDLNTGKRGDRYEHCLALIRKLTGCESALVVNNNAAAVLLILNTLAEGREVIIARGELIEIGGSFRIPEIMVKSGAKLREVGTTNRTFLKDYQRAISEMTGLIMKAHTSNYKIRGFVHEEESAELAALAKSNNVPFYYDIGSSLLFPLENFGNAGEPTILAEVAKGIDVISGSGDKLLGGPQAGIIIGRADLIAAMKRNPLLRAFRPDKFTLAALETTLLLYLDPVAAKREIPTLRMLYEDPAQVRKRAVRIGRRMAGRIGNLVTEVMPLYSEVGGGSMPDVTVPSFGLSLKPAKISATELEVRLRTQDTPVIGRMEKGLLLLDMRTIRPEDEPILISSIEAALRDGK